MDDRTPSDPNAPGRPHTEYPVPEPHRGEPAPPPEEGLRPEADPNLIRPEQEEPLGPAGGLIPTAGAKAKEEATPDGDPEAEALLAQMGVEEEGIESGQILGLVLAVIVAIAALVVVLIYLIYVPYKTQVQVDAASAARAIEYEQVRTEGLAKLNYNREDSTYSIPIDRAMGLVAGEYGGAGPYPQATDIPNTFQKWNTLPISWNSARAVQVPTSRGYYTAPVPETGIETDPLNPTGAPGTFQEAERSRSLDIDTGEEVGLDEPEDDIIDIR